jgi:hypothetical protein
MATFQTPPKPSWRRLPERVLRMGCLFAITMSLSAAPASKTSVSIIEREFYINGKPTYEGRQWRGHRIQGLLMNSRMVQGIFEDLNTNTVQRWAYPDTRKYDPERNTREFLRAMPEWRRHGLLAFTINLQGGSPEGYSREQPWHNSAIEADGSLRSNYMARLERILDRADELGMAVILGYFYFGQDQRLTDEAAVIRATDNATHWLLERGYRNVLIEINNECNVRYDHDILQPRRVDELIERVRNTTQDNHRFYVGTSYGGGTIPLENVVRVSDFLLIHGNGIADPNKIAEMVRKTRAVPGYIDKPILFNEDDHFDFEKPMNNFVAALSEYASWGYFDPGKNNYEDGYQSPPVRWDLNTDRKRGFFKLLSEITSATEPVRRASAKAGGKVRVSKTTYHGWPDSLVLSNGKAEVTVVPRIGRIMQFGFAGEEGVFWENRALDGVPAVWNPNNWINFGGDKAWPAPEGEWSKHMRLNAWQPPPAFDGTPAQARVDPNGDVVLTTTVDVFYGIRVERRIHLDGELPVMTVTTSYERVADKPIKAGIWVITQLRNPERLYIPRAGKSQFSEGYVLLSKAPPPSVRVQPRWLSLERDTASAYKIGADAGTLLWVGKTAALRIDSPRVAGAEYPDKGSSAEIYTNPNPLEYIELEMLGPLQTLKPGDRIERVNTYTLIRRTQSDPDREAERILQQWN